MLSEKAVFKFILPPHPFFNNAQLESMMFLYFLPLQRSKSIFLTFPRAGLFDPLPPNGGYGPLVLPTSATSHGPLVLLISPRPRRPESTYAHPAQPLVFQTQAYLLHKLNINILLVIEFVTQWPNINYLTFQDCFPLLFTSLPCQQIVICFIFLFLTEILFV